LSALLVSADLFSTSKLTGDAALAGCRLSVVADPALAASHLAGSPAALVAIDLGTVKVDLTQLVAQLRAAVPGPIAIVAYGPHVHEDRLQAARDAGCDQVLARGQFLAGAQALFRQAASSSRPQADA
jgi:CheY-like chemotaxis protein